jgi:hypothetical protein
VLSEPEFEGGGITARLTVKPSARARTMRLRVDPRTAAVILTVPHRVSRRKAVQWALGHRLWIEKALSDIPARSRLADGGELPLYGIAHRIDWSPERSRLVSVEEGRILMGGPADTIETRLLRWLKRHALALLDRETRHFAAKAGVSVARVGVGDPSSRWGSCSQSGAIRYSWRLLLAPEWVRRATVAHEVAHRVHMNHGPEFHDLVAALLGTDPKPARLWLRRNGAALHGIARGG